MITEVEQIKLLALCCSHVPHQSVNMSPDKHKLLLRTYNEQIHLKRNQNAAEVGGLHLLCAGRRREGNKGKAKTVLPLLPQVHRGKRFLGSVNNKSQNISINHCVKIDV